MWVLSVSLVQDAWMLEAAMQQRPEKLLDQERHAMRSGSRSAAIAPSPSSLSTY